LLQTSARVRHQSCGAFIPRHVDEHGRDGDHRKAVGDVGNLRIVSRGAKRRRKINLNDQGLQVDVSLKLSQAGHHRAYMSR